LYWFFLSLFVVALVAAIIFYLYRTRFQRPFKPRLEWKPASDVAVDFNRPAASRVLVGMLQVVNEEMVPWFGRLWHNEEQPTRDAVFTLNYNFFKESSLAVASPAPIGFIRVEQNGDAQESSLDLSTSEAISHGKKVFLFLATESLLDYRPPASNDQRAADESFKIDLGVKMEWGQNGEREAAGNWFAKNLRGRLGRTERGTLARDMQCELTVKPEQERKPLVSYVPSTEPKPHFSMGRQIEVGKFIFESQSEHDFATPFEWGDYTFQVRRGTEPLSGEPIRLESKRLVVLPQEKVEVPVLLDCDGQLVPNPAPYNHTYAFKLTGNFDPSSDVREQETTIYRDPKRADIILKILHPEPTREIYWTPERKPEQRLLASDGSGASEMPIEAATLRLAAQDFKIETTDNRPYDLLTFEFGNSAESGDGFVDVQITAKIDCDPEEKGGLHMSDGRKLDELLGVYFSDQRSASVHLNEGDAAQTRVVRLFPGLVSGIDGAIISSENLRAEVKLAINVHPDQGEDFQRELSVVIPLSLEQLPSPNWLCIDYGTSAIAAAFGSGQEERILPIPLQEIKGDDGFWFSRVDPDNMESGSRFLLPSWIICDADIRETGEQARPYKTTRRGFPGYAPPSYKPGDPAFVSLPALNDQFVSHSGRIIYSIKSWLGKASQHIPLDTEIKYEDEDGREMHGRLLPLDKMVESSFAALIEAYLLAQGTNYRADQIIICHPNTFTRKHKERLRENVYKAFSRRFGVQRQERIHLISESDAVAYYYCRTQMRENPRGGTERLLVYDFGAGTLDLSLIKIEWNKEPTCYPARWKVEGRIGVPVAGNYIDETIARIIDRILRERLVINTDPRLKYTYHVVDRSFVAGSEFQHRIAIRNLWQAVRQAKHKWKGTEPFTVVVGSTGEKDWGVVGWTEIEQETLAKAPPSGEIGFWIKDGNICLSIPSGEIHGDGRMQEFRGFVVQTVIDELLQAANVSANEVNTVVVSGRGALWPGLRDEVKRKFPGAEHPDLMGSAAMKSAVVQGAIARQDLNIDFDEAEASIGFKPKLGVLINNNEDIIIEDDWDKPIDLSRSPKFRLVQINLKNPNPRADFKSLRKHFYIDLDDRAFNREENLIQVVRVEEPDGRFRLNVKDSRGRLRSFLDEARGSQVVTSPPWPVGSFLLDPFE
jgi:hypothetical protein